MREVKIKRSWQEITVKEAFTTQIILSNEFYEPDEKFEHIILLLSDLTKQELINMPIAEYTKCVNAVLFTMKEPEKVPITKELVINGEKFDVDINLNNVGTGQYYAAQNILKSDDEFFLKQKKILGVYIRPKGKEWGEFDYDENVEFIYNNLRGDIGMTYGVFFYRIANKYMKASQSYLEKMKREEMKHLKNMNRHSIKPGV